MNAPQLFCGALALAVGVTACDRPASRADVQQTASDAAARVKAESEKARDQLADVYLSTKVHSKFVADRDINASDLSVSSHDGVVTLKGHVLNEPMRDLAVAIARNTQGVTQVVNQLSVEIAGPARPQAGTPGAAATTGTVNSAPLTAATDDARITSSIQSRFYVDDRIRARRLTVSSTGGVVTLSGEVGDETERAQALQLARTTDGVSRVEDSLTVAAAPPATAAPPVAADGDDTLSARVRSRLTSDAQLKGASIEVTAKSGVVLLQGTTSSNAAKQRALTLARGTDGVTQIVDRIRVGKATK